MGIIYVTVVQAVLFYGSEMWVLIPRICRFMGIFRHRVARRLMGKLLRRGRDGGWMYPPLAEAIVEAGLPEVETYVSHQYNTVSQFISTRPIMDPCLAAKKRPGSRVAKRWWEQDGFYL